MTRTTLFLSDVHLDKEVEDINDLFLNFFSKFDQKIDALYILGDLFEVWIGDDENNEYQQKIIQSIRSITNQGIPVYLMHGNRDFLLGQSFLEKTGCQLLSDETKVDIYHTPVLLMHGDTLCTRDINYLKLRKILHHPWFQKFFLFLPLRWRKKMAHFLRKKSAYYTKKMSKDRMDVTQTAVEAVMIKYDVLYLIHGHTHQPTIHHFNLQNKDAARFVLGAWHDQAEILVWDELGNKNLVKLR